VDLLPFDVGVEHRFDLKVMIDYASTFKAIDRESIYLYLVGESQNEIAEILNISLDNVSTKISRLKNKITSYLNKGMEHE